MNERWALRTRSLLLNSMRWKGRDYLVAHCCTLGGLSVAWKNVARWLCFGWRRGRWRIPHGRWCWEWERTDHCCILEVGPKIFWYSRTCVRLIILCTRGERGLSVNFQTGFASSTHPEFANLRWPTPFLLSHVLGLSHSGILVTPSPPVLYHVDWAFQPLLLSCS